MLGLGSMMVRVDRMYSNMVLYDVLLGFILMGLIIRLIMYLSFQKRLSVIGGTLVSGQLYANKHYWGGAGDEWSVRIMQW